LTGVSDVAINDDYGFEDNSLCFIRRTDGSVSCVGDNYDDQLGLGTNAIFDFNLTKRVKFPPGLVPTNISTSADSYCVLFSNGRAGCWGANYDGQLGTGSDSYVGGPLTMGANFSLVNVGTGLLIQQLVSLTETVCVLLRNGAGVKCWGYWLVA